MTKKATTIEVTQIDLSKYKDELKELAEHAERGTVVLAMKKTIKYYGGIKVFSLTGLNVEVGEEIAVIPLKHGFLVLKLK
jgi:hypothetical protein